MLDFNASSVLLVLSLIWAVSQLVHGYLLRPLIAWGWLALAGVVLVVAGAGGFAFPHQAGYVSGVLALGLGVFPQLLYQYLSRLITHGKYGEACAVARLLAVLHPLDDFPLHVRVLAALFAAQRGDFSAVEGLVGEVKALTSPLATQSAYLMLRALGRYEESAAWLAERLAGQPLHRAPHLAVYYVRALAEARRLDEAIALYLFMRQSFPARLYNLLRYRGLDLILAAFAGRIEHTEKLLERFAKPGSSIQAYWLATARMAAGEPVQEELRHLLETEPSAIMRRAIECRIAQAGAWQPPVLAEEEDALLCDLEEELDQANLYIRGGARAVKPYVTRVLAWLCLFMFFVELSAGGATNLETLWRLGAMNVDAVLDGEWWRLPAHAFLHLGWPHLLLNLAGLFYFGPFLERTLGRLRFLICYGVSGVGAAAALIPLDRLGWVKPDMVLVGASGAIMGILGATGAVLLRGWRRESAPAARKRFLGIVSLISLQVVFDQMFPQVSSLIHVLGFVIGFVFALVLQGVLTRGKRAEEARE